MAFLGKKLILCLHKTALCVTIRISYSNLTKILLGGWENSSVVRCSYMRILSISLSVWLKYVLPEKSVKAIDKIYESGVTGENFLQRDDYVALKAKIGVAINRSEWSNICLFSSSSSS